MQITIENETLRIVVSSAGAELASLFHKGPGREYLWQGSADWWPRRAPVLFPIVGKLNGNQYRIGETAYSLPQHGFARDEEFEIEQRNKAEIQCTLKSIPESLLKFPFQFDLVITYRLEGDVLNETYQVKNTGPAKMWFSIGAHPGFAFATGEQLSDYEIVFEKKETLVRHLLDEGLFNGKTENVSVDSSILALNDALFTKDAIVLKGMKSQLVTLKSKRSKYALKFSFSSFPYFGIWSKPGAPFVCLEPWCGLADKMGFVGDFNRKEGIESLEAGGVFTRSFSMGPR